MAHPVVNVDHRSGGVSEAFFEVWSKAGAGNLTPELERFRVPSLPPAGFACAVVLEGCMAMVTWRNASRYEALELRVNGTLVETLPGSAESASAPLPVPAGAGGDLAQRRDHLRRALSAGHLHGALPLAGAALPAFGGDLARIARALGTTKRNVCLRFSQAGIRPVDLRG